MKIKLKSSKPCLPNLCPVCGSNFQHVSSSYINFGAKKNISMKVCTKCERKYLNVKYIEKLGDILFLFSFLYFILVSSKLIIMPRMMDYVVALTLATGLILSLFGIIRRRLILCLNAKHNHDNTCTFWIKNKACAQEFLRLNSAAAVNKISQKAVQNSNTLDKTTFTAINALSLDFPVGWKLRQEENRYDLSCVTEKEDAAINVRVYYKLDLNNNTTTEDIFARQINDLRLKTEKLELVDETNNTNTDRKRIKTAVYSADKESKRYYYTFSLVEFFNYGKFAIIVQICALSDYSKYRKIFDDIVCSCRPIQ